MSQRANLDQTFGPIRRDTFQLRSFAPLEPRQTLWLQLALIPALPKPGAEISDSWINVSTTREVRIPTSFGGSIEPARLILS